jgi:hypothetical protein
VRNHLADTVVVPVEAIEVRIAPQTQKEGAVGANTGSVENANRGRSDPGHPDDTQESRREQSDVVVGPRHLYLIRSAIPPQGSSIMKSPPTSQGARNGRLDRSVQVQIGRLLRDVFADVAEEPVPERFVVLLEALQSKEQQR